MSKLSTICFLKDGDSVWLAMKKRGFGEDKWNGYGGKPEKDETIEQSAIREIFEESEYQVKVKEKDLQKFGIIDFFEEGELVFTSHIFIIEKWDGEPKESEEMKPLKFKIKDIPYNDMWASDKEWIPLILEEGKKIKGVFHYKKGMEESEKFEYEEVESF